MVFWGCFFFFTFSFITNRLLEIKKKKKKHVPINTHIYTIINSAVDIFTSKVKTTISVSYAGSRRARIAPPVGIMSTCYMVKCNHIIVEVQYYTTHESPLISILFPVRQTFCKFKKKKILSNNLESKFFGHSFSHHFQLFF